LPRGDAASTGPGSKGFDDTLTACLTLGLFEKEDDIIRLDPSLPPEIRDRRKSVDLRSLFRELILREHLNVGIWESTEGARDLTRALAWYLGQNPLQPPMPWNEPNGVDIAQERQFATADRVFSNDTRWGAFDRWAIFLGFGFRLPRENKSVLVPDPTPVLRVVLPSVLETPRREIGSVIEELALRLPILDGGTYRREVESRMKPEFVPASDDQLSPSLALALLRLRDERILVLEDLPDVLTKRMRLPESFGPERTLTHVSLEKPKAKGKQ
jgi:hypothetical protein